jgi:hypothetical protein
MRRLASLPISEVASCVAGAEYDEPRSNGHPPCGTQPCAASPPDRVPIIGPRCQTGEVLRSARLPAPIVIRAPCAICSRFIEADAALLGSPCKHIQCDESWSFYYAKQRNVPTEHQGEFGYGDAWTWTGLCAETKLVPSWLVDERTALNAELFMRDLASRLSHCVSAHHRRLTALSECRRGCACRRRATQLADSVASGHGPGDADLIRPGASHESICVTLLGG